MHLKILVNNYLLLGNLSYSEVCKKTAACMLLGWRILQTKYKSYNVQKRPVRKSARSPHFSRFAIILLLPDLGLTAIAEYEIQK
jgi:hypothetical protein